MNKVHVIVIPSENEALSQPGELKAPSTKSFVSWIPIDYVVGQLKQDVARYWQLKASKHELYDPQGTLLVDDLHLEAANMHHPAVLTFKKREHPTPSAETKPTGIQSSRLDPFWLHQQLLELFSYYALQNRHGKALRLTSYQFKHLLQKATASTVFQKKRKLEFEKRATLVFRGVLATPGSNGGSFSEFLDALVDVACFMFPKEASKELALEKLATQYVIPYHEREQRLGGSNAFSWTQLADLLTQSKVRSVMQRFAKPLNDLATAYSSNVGLAHRRCVLKYPEFHRFLRDMIPKTVHITSSELCKVFMHSSRAGRYSFDSEELPSGSETGKLEVTCAKMMDVVGYLALLAIPRLVKAKETASADLANVVLTGKLAVQAIKALLHHISNHLSAKSSSHLKKNAEFSRARVQFLLEFNKLHREDALLDYQSGCSTLLRELPPKSANFSSNIPVPTQVPDQNELELDVEFSWELGSTNEEEVEESGTTNDSDSSASSPASRTSVCPLDSQILIDLRRRELEDFASITNEADEIYAFLAGELQRHALVRRPDTPDTVPHMLDIWVSAGEKYSEVVNHVEAPSLLRANLLTRFGQSLAVFATQVLKSATKVYSYEELLYVTNARVYSVSSELWRDEAASFTLDLAVETLSLASGKLTQASDELSALVSSAKVNDLRIPSDDDEVSSTSTGGEDDEEEAEPASALYERYLCCLFHRANCLAAYADVLAHNKRVAVDFELACCFEDAAQSDERPSKAEIFFTSVIVLAKTSPPGAFYWEAEKMYRFLLQHSKGGPNVPRSRLQHNLAMAQFKLATHLPRGCDSEKQLLENALQNLDACGLESCGVDASVLASKRAYIRAILVVRHKFFLAESVAPPAEASEGLTQEQDDHLAPFYRFVLAAAFGEFDSEKKGVMLQPELSLLSKTCGYGAVSNDAMQWLIENFEHQEGGLTERGVLQYFGWLAEADPIAFCSILDLLTAKHTGAHNISISSGDVRLPRKQSIMKTTPINRKTTPLVRESDRLRAKRSGIADCVVVLSGKMTSATEIDVSDTMSPSDIRLDPQVIDVLPSRASLPEELSKFCFPDDMYLSTEPFAPKTFDIVLTDIKGVRLYGSCLHFCEEKHPMDVLALISATQKGRTVNLPSWVSLKDIQQGHTKWKCFMPKCLCVLSSSPLFQTFRNFLVHLYRVSLADSTTLPLESLVFNFLERTPLPSANATQTVFKLGDATCLLSGFPATLPLFSPSEVDFTILFQCLSPENILKVYGYLLTEKKVVLSSASRPILTHVAETLRALLHPFECQQVYIPVLPLSLIEFICAPVPFFMGIRSDHRLERLTSEGAVLVDLDNNDVRLPPNEELPSLSDVKARKLLHALRKLSVWPASQRTRHSAGHCFNDNAPPPSPAFFEPSQPSDEEVAQTMHRHDDLTEKWGELQALFSSFATRILKEVRKHCSKPSATATSGNVGETVVFDERGFLALHPSLREFCTHLFQTQLFQRSLENIWTVNDISIPTESEQYWRAVRSKSMLRKPSESSEDAGKSPRRRIIQAPLPPRRCTPPDTTGRTTTDGFPSFNGQLYDELLEEFTTSGERLESSICESSAPLRSLLLSSETSCSSIFTSPSFHDGDADALQLVNAARRRLEGRRSSEAVE